MAAITNPLRCSRASYAFYATWGSGLGLLDMLGDVHVDDDIVVAYSLSVLSQRSQCSQLLLLISRPLSSWLTDDVATEKRSRNTSWLLISRRTRTMESVAKCRALTIPDTLPETLRPLRHMAADGRPHRSIVSLAGRVRSGEIFVDRT